MSLLSLNQLPSYLLNRPKCIDLKEYPRSAVSGKEFPTRYGIYNDIGHFDVWELIVPLTNAPDVFVADDRQNIYSHAPFIKFYFFHDELKDIDIDYILEERNDAMAFSILTSKTKGG